MAQRGRRTTTVRGRAQTQPRTQTQPHANTPAHAQTQPIADRRSRSPRRREATSSAHRDHGHAPSQQPEGRRAASRDRFEPPQRVPSLGPEEQDEEDLDPFADEEEPAPVSAAVREQFEELLVHLSESQDAGWKIDQLPSNSPLCHLGKVARFAMRDNGPYLAIGQHIVMGLTICAAPTIEEAVKRSAALRECLQPERERFMKVGEWLLERAPFLEPMLPLFEERPLDLTLLGTFIDYHGRQARTADISSLKQHLHKWIPEVELRRPGSGNPLVISPRIKGIFANKRSEWGWNSLWTARLLVWRKHRDDFDKDPDALLERIRNGELKMNHSGFPSFTYNETSRANELATGLFMGDLLKQGYRCVWTSPESSTNEPGVEGSGRPSISRANGIDTVRPGNIAYIACLMRHILSSEASWSIQDKKAFNGALFYDKIVRAFEQEALRKPVLEFYQYEVYGGFPDAHVSDDEEDDFAALARELSGGASSNSASGSGSSE